MDINEYECFSLLLGDLEDGLTSKMITKPYIPGSWSLYGK